MSRDLDTVKSAYLSYNSGRAVAGKTKSAENEQGRLSQADNMASISTPLCLDVKAGKEESDLINYSPKHRWKANSLSTHRNTKNLSLKMEGTNTEALIYRKIQMDNRNDKRKRHLNLSIPCKTQSGTISQPQLQRHEDGGYDEKTKCDDVNNYTKYNWLNRDMTKSNGDKSRDSIEDDISIHGPLLVNKSRNLTEAFDDLCLTEFKSVAVDDPEELYEIDTVETYPDGPANVLNNSIFLYSDPSSTDGPKIDINDFDLIINVAKECKNLSANFNSSQSSKEYLHIPWSHTSLILRELPELTAKIKEFDDSQKPVGKRKVLVHCQCGVSRSACVIVAYFMFKFNMGVNEAYELLKTGTQNPKNKVIRSRGYVIDACEGICPNMSLIFELMEYRNFLNSKRLLIEYHSMLDI